MVMDIIRLGGPTPARPAKNPESDGHLPMVRLRGGLNLPDPDEHGQLNEPGLGGFFPTRKPKLEIK